MIGWNIDLACIFFLLDWIRTLEAHDDSTPWKTHQLTVVYRGCQWWYCRIIHWFQSKIKACRQFIRQRIFMFALLQNQSANVTTKINRQLFVLDTISQWFSIGMLNHWKQNYTKGDRWKKWRDIYGETLTNAVSIRWNSCSSTHHEYLFSQWLIRKKFSY